MQNTCLLHPDQQCPRFPCDQWGTCNAKRNAQQYPATWLDPVLDHMGQRTYPPYFQSTQEQHT